MEIIHHVGEEYFKSPKRFVRAFSDQTFPIWLHDHSFYEIIIVTKGKGTHRISNSSFTAVRGDVFVIPPTIPHSFHSIKNLEIQNILLKTSFVRERQHKSKNVPGYFQLMEIEPFLRQNYDQSMFLHLNTIQLAELQQDIKFIEETHPLYHTDNMELQYLSAWKIIYYLSYLLYKQIHKSSNDTSNKKYETQILNTLEYIHQNFSNKMSIDELANRVFLSRATFLRHFQAMCGCTPIQYINAYRREKAMEMLELSTLSKTEIAHLCGFYDQSHMKKCIEAGRSANTK